MRTFWLGTHMTNWLAIAGVPLFIARQRLAIRKRLPRAIAPWALDSGGFTELSKNGHWTVPPAQYVAEVRRFRDEIGSLEWAAIQDWMCEPWIVAKTGLSVEEHQRRTVASYLDLRARAPEIPWTPVLQGWREVEYFRHVEMYDAAGIDLFSLPVVGLGSVCRRQAMNEAECIVRRLSRLGLRLHGFGFKTLGLRRCADALESADSLAWSFHARKNPRLAGCTHKTCANCLLFAMKWRAELLASLGSARPRPFQFPMFQEAA